MAADIPRLSEDLQTHFEFSPLIEIMAVNPKSLRIAIIGGGIGGLFAALSLDWHCKDRVQISVYEQALEYKEIGAGVGIGANATKLLYKIGLGEGLEKITGDTEGIWVSFRRFDTGEDVVSVHEERSQKYSNSPVQRAEFLDLLLAAVKERGAASLFTKKCCKLVKVGIPLKHELSLITSRCSRTAWKLSSTMGLSHLQIL